MFITLESLQLYCTLGLYRSWKNLEVMEFKVEIFQIWKIMENGIRYGKVWQNHGKRDF